MEPQEARRKLGSTVEKDDGTEVWEPDYNKVRGLMLKWARDEDEVRHHSNMFKGHAAVDHFKEWAQDKLGDGYHAVFASDVPNPVGKFDRVGSQTLGNIMESFYKSNDEFQELVDEKGEEYVPEFYPREQDSENLDDAEDSGRIQFINSFYLTHDKRVEGFPDVKVEPDPKAYKYRMKEFVMKSDRIRGSYDGPDAESFTEEFIEWVSGYVSNVDSVIDIDAGYTDDIFCVPDREQVIEWARQLWSDDDEFRETLKEKWNKPVETDDEDGEDDEPEPNEVDDDRQQKEWRSGGQQTIGAFGDEQ